VEMESLERLNAVVCNKCIGNAYYHFRPSSHQLSNTGMTTWSEEEESLRSMDRKWPAACISEFQWTLSSHQDEMTLTDGVEQTEANGT
jgi:hypothetical protein